MAPISLQKPKRPWCIESTHLTLWTMPKATALEKAIILPRLKKSLETFTSTGPFPSPKNNKKKNNDIPQQVELWMYTPEIQHIADENMGRIPIGFLDPLPVPASIFRGRTLLNFRGVKESSQLKFEEYQNRGKKRRRSVIKQLGTFCIYGLSVFIGPKQIDTQIIQYTVYSIQYTGYDKSKKRWITTADFFAIELIEHNPNLTHLLKNHSKQWTFLKQANNKHHLPG